MERFYKMIQEKQPVLVAFYADWCPHCQRMHPVIDQLKERTGGKFTVTKYDVDDQENNQLLKYYQVHAVPTMIIFKDGAQVWRQSGVMSPGHLDKIIKQHI